MKINWYWIVFVSLSCISCRMPINYGAEFNATQQYRNLRSALKEKDKVIVLDLSNKNLETLSADIGEFRNLRVLNLSGNNLKALPKEIKHLKKLELLFVGSNQLGAIPREIGELESLRRFEGMRNDLKTLPQEMINLRNLKRLNVAFNPITVEDIDFLKNALPDCDIIVEVLL